MDIRKLLTPLMQVLVLVFVLHLVMALTVLAQDGTTPANQGWGELIKNFSLSSVVTLLWGLAGPTLTVAITATVNTLVKGYVPREIQIPLAGIISAIAAGWTGDNSVQAAGVGFAEGVSIQTALSLPSKKFLASAPGEK